MTLTLQEAQPKQMEFLTAENRFIAYGGARGGGKSWAVRQKAILLALNYSGIKLLILRRTFPELRENHILPLKKMLGDVAAYREIDKAFSFPNGSRIKFGYCANESDVDQYQGQEYDVVFLDEATQFTQYQYSTLTACLRGANDFPKRMYLTCNPGGIGHYWVKRLFVDRDFLPDELPEDYKFIKATVHDNKILIDKDAGYIQMLKNLEPVLRRAWLEGDWDIFIGQYFTEFRRETHVLEPFDPPESWRRYFTMDYGLDMLAGYFIAVAPEGTAYVYREIYESGLIISDAAKRINAAIGGDKIHAFYAPPDLWNKRQDTGRSVAEIFYDYGIRLQRASNERVSGWLDVKEWVRPFECGGKSTALLQIFENCVNLIRTLPALQFDKIHVNDVASEPHELTHAPDAIRYFIAGRPRPNRAGEKNTVYNFKSEKPKRGGNEVGEDVVVV